MTPRDFLSAVAKTAPLPVYLFIGPDAWDRAQCRRELTKAAIGDDNPESALTIADLDETPFAAVIDDASSYSLFASRRLIWVRGAEAALPRRLTAAAEEEGAGALLAQYVGNPTDGVVVVFDCIRYEFDGDDKTKVERVKKFYSAAPGIVEFPRYGSVRARQLAQDRAKELGVAIGDAEIEVLVEAVGGDAMRVVNEMEKLSLASEGRPVTLELIAVLVPNAQQTNLFELVESIAAADRRKSLDLLDSLVRDGEYLPLVLTFVGTLFRLALAAQEAQLRGSSQIQSYFQRQGTPMWRARAEQVERTMRAFPQERLRRAVQVVYETDRGLRDTRPDDRTIMEKLVWSLTKAA